MLLSLPSYFMGRGVVGIDGSYTTSANSTPPEIPPTQREFSDGNLKPFSGYHTHLAPCSLSRLENPVLRF